MPLLSQYCGDVDGSTKLEWIGPRQAVRLLCDQRGGKGFMPRGWCVEVTLTVGPETCHYPSWGPSNTRIKLDLAPLKPSRFRHSLVFSSVYLGL